MIRPTHDAMAEEAFALQEHRDLLPWIDRIHDVGCAVGHLPASQLAVSLHRVLVWLESDLQAHAAWEETWLYPELDERAGTPWATRTMRFGHEQVRAAIRRLAAEQAHLDHELTTAQAGHLASHVFGLEAVLRAHLECEERVLLPLLEDAVVAHETVPTA
jgi:iron-sulfur cluster repair protein YtfE (RIC family)